MQHQSENQTGFVNSEQLPSDLSFGAHELFDARETIGTISATLEQYKLFDEHIQCKQLKGILTHQHDYLTQLYNTTVEAFQTGERPEPPTTIYHMQTGNEVQYGLASSQPKTPANSASEINDEGYSGYMLGLLKSCATACTTAALETTNPVLRRVFQDSVPNLCEMGYEIFLYQNQKHYYQVPQMPEPTTQTMLNSFGQTSQTKH